MAALACTLDCDPHAVDTVWLSRTDADDRSVLRQDDRIGLDVTAACQASSMSPRSPAGSGAFVTTVQFAWSSVAGVSFLNQEAAPTIGRSEIPHLAPMR